MNFNVIQVNLATNKEVNFKIGLFFVAIYSIEDLKDENKT